MSNLAETLPQSTTAVVAAVSSTPSAVEKSEAPVVVAVPNWFATLEQIMTTTTKLQREVWAPKIRELEVADQKRGYPLSGISKPLVRMVRDYVASKHPQ